MSAAGRLGSRYTPLQLLRMWRRARKVAALREDVDVDRFLAAIRKVRQGDGGVT